MEKHYFGLLSNVQNRSNARIAWRPPVDARKQRVCHGLRGIRVDFANKGKMD